MQSYKPLKSHAELQQTTLLTFLPLSFEENKKMLHMNPLPSRGFTRNIKSYFSEKQRKSIQDWSAAALIDALKVQSAS